jgi:hypothetical protein
MEKERIEVVSRERFQGVDKGAMRQGQAFMSWCADYLVACSWYLDPFNPAEFIGEAIN